jgi:hypothetical protein
MEVPLVAEIAIPGVAVGIDNHVVRQRLAPSARNVSMRTAVWIVLRADAVIE